MDDHERQRFLREGLAVYLRHSAEHGELYGAVQSSILGTAYFSGVLELLWLFEEAFDQVRAPQPTHQLRSFRSSRRGDATKEERTDVMKKPETDGQPLDGQPTFLVKVRYRQNATWQGTVQWVEAKKSQNFRSTLELLNLMEEAVSAGGEGTALASWSDLEE